MSATTTATAETVKKHPSGGTYTVVKAAYRPNGWGICITRWTTYRGETVYQIHRVSSDNSMFCIGQRSTEEAARKFANQVWKAER